MKTALNIICGITLSIAVGFSLLAVGNGKVGELFGEEFFIAAASDMKAVFVLMLLAVPATIWLLLSLYLTGQQRNQYRDKIEAWDRWHKQNIGKTIV